MFLSVDSTLKVHHKQTSGRLSSNQSNSDAANRYSLPLPFSCTHVPDSVFLWSQAVKQTYSVVVHGEGGRKSLQVQRELDVGYTGQPPRRLCVYSLPERRYV